MGEAIIVSGNAQDLTIAKLQLAINRIIRGGRTDPTVTDGVRKIQEQAKIADQVKESGVLGPVTGLAYSQAKVIAAFPSVLAKIDLSFPNMPAGLTTISQVEEAARNLNAVADQRGYPSPDTVQLKSGGTGAGASLFGAGAGGGAGGGGGDSKKGPRLPIIGEITPVKVVVGVGIAIALFFVVKKRRAAA